MTTSDLDPAIKTALNHLHSNKLSSASDIRILLDSMIKKQFGSSKMLVNRLSKKHLAEEEISPGVLASPLPEPEPPLEILDSPPPHESAEEPPEIECIDDEEPEQHEIEDIEMNEDFNDLNCIVCDSMMYSATNRLMECGSCHSLYHSLCHSPAIPMEDDEDNWTCSNCNEKSNLSKTPVPVIPESSVIPKSSSSSSAPSSASSSPYHRSTEVPPSKTGSSKSSSSSSSHKDDLKGGAKSSSTHVSSRSEKSSSSSTKKHKSSKSSSKDHHDKKSKKSK